MIRDVQILPQDSNEYFRLEQFCKILNRDSPNNHSYTIRNTYCDYGGCLKWTTIVDNTTDCQVLSPAKWKKIVDDTQNLVEIETDFFNDMHCQDKSSN